MIELMTCPFCGGEAMVFVNESVFVMCKKCHCQTMPRRDSCIAECEKYNALDAVLKNWNSRPKPVAVYEYEGTYYCGGCNSSINKGDNFCHECGCAVELE